MTIRLNAEAQAAIARGDEVALPESTWRALEAGDNPIKTSREFRSLTAEALAQRLGWTAEEVEAVEGDVYGIDDARLPAVALALHVPVGLLTGR